MDGYKKPRIRNQSKYSRLNKRVIVPPPPPKQKTRTKEPTDNNMCSIVSAMERIKGKLAPFESCKIPAPPSCPVPAARKDTRLTRHAKFESRLSDVKPENPEPSFKRGSSDRKNRKRFQSFMADATDADSLPSTPSITLSDSDLELDEIDSDLYGLKKTLPVECKNKVCTTSKKGNLLRQLQTFGYGTGFHIPFTDKESKELEEQVEDLQEQNVTQKILLRDNKAHNQVMKVHVLNLQHEVTSFKRLIEATKQECDNSETLASLAERVEHQVASELVRTNEELIAYCERNCWREELFKSVQSRIEGIIQKHKIGQDKMDYFERHVLRNEDVMDKVKYFRSLDEHEIFRCEEQDHELVWENRCLRMELDVSSMNTDKLHELYNRMSTDYRKQFKQRRDLLALWNRSVEQMQNRDDEIGDIGNQYFMNRSKYLQLRSKLKEAEKQMLAKSRSVEFMTHKQLEFDRIVQGNREKLDKSQKIVVMLKDEYLLHHIEVQQIIACTLEVRNRIKDVNQQNLDYYSRETEMEDSVSVLKERLNEQNADTADYAYSVEKLEDMLNYEDTRQTQLNRHVYRLRQFLWERHLDKDRIQNYGQKLEDRSHRLKISLTVLESKSMSYLDKLADRQSKDYRLDLDLSTIEVKTIQFHNEAIDPRLYKIKQTRNTLKSTLDQHTNNMNFIKQELFELKIFIKIVETEIESLELSRIALEKFLYSARKEEARYAKIQGDRQNTLTQTLVDANLFKLVLAKAQNRYHTKMEDMAGLALRRNSLEFVAKERKAEIREHVEFLNKQLLEYKERNQKIKIRAADVVVYMGKLVGKFQIFTRLMAPSGDHDEAENSFANQVRRMAREKETMTAEAKKWENRLVEASKEVEGLTNALLVMEVSNSNFRKNLSAAQFGSAEHASYAAMLENEKRYTVLKKRCERIHGYLIEKENYYLNAVKHIQKVMETQLELGEQKKRDASAAELNLVLQENQLVRWDQLIASIMIVLAKKMDEATKYESEIEMIVIALREKYEVRREDKHAVTELDSFLTQAPSSKVVVYEFLDERRRSIKAELIQRGFRAKKQSRFAEMFHERKDSFLEENEGEGDGEVVGEVCQENMGEYYCEMKGESESPETDPDPECIDQACETETGIMVTSSASSSPPCSAFTTSNSTCSDYI